MMPADRSDEKWTEMLSRRSQRYMKISTFMTKLLLKYRIFIRIFKKIVVQPRTPLILNRLSIIYISLKVICIQCIFLSGNSLPVNLQFNGPSLRLLLDGYTENISPAHTNIFTNIWNLIHLYYLDVLSYDTGTFWNLFHR